jgi:hypothetical protein
LMTDHQSILSLSALGPKTSMGMQAEGQKDSWFQTFRRVLHVVCFLLGNSPASESKRRGNYPEQNITDRKMEAVPTKEIFVLRNQYLKT